jgi:hypothetical protein
VPTASAEGPLAVLPLGARKGDWPCRRCSKRVVPADDPAAPDVHRSLRVAVDVGVAARGSGGVAPLHPPHPLVITAAASITQGRRCPVVERRRPALAHHGHAEVPPYLAQQLRGGRLLVIVHSGAKLAGTIGRHTGLVALACSRTAPRPAFRLGAKAVAHGLHGGNPSAASQAARPPRT